MKTTFIETCIEILKKESNPTLKNIVSLAEQELSEIKQAVEHTLAPDGAYLCGKCGLMSRTTKCENCGHIYKRPAGSVNRWA